MNRETILKKAIEKAVKNGYPEGTYGLSVYNGIGCLSEGYLTLEQAARVILMDCDFAKAFFKNILCECEGDSIGRCSFFGKEWQYHLQQMVLEEDPISYLERFL